ncbi:MULTISPECIES: hypothetical protein [unclassified Burkholderia]|uniref:DUF7836 family putative zinc-binding protein n=1 Tax=unclassified Burkholderia TaxID=2613784 RepID=UPI001E428AD0|nr:MULTISPECIES: hypothetical protein [unclassified Burkholderia]UEP31270.1 hypothetical protein LMA01_18810 [Burkholderia sp. B21-007]UEP43454.1 hypothetical protein LMA02_25690 [Burkholderia sp. B21-005]
MTINFDSHRVDVSCPKCNKKVSETLGRLKRDPTLTCPSCKSDIRIDASQFRETERALNKQIEDLKKSLGKLR